MSFLLKKDDLLGQKTELSTAMNRKDTTINTTATTINSSGTSNISSSLIAATTSSSTTEKDYCTQNLEIVFKNVVVDGPNEVISLNSDANGIDPNRLATEKSKLSSPDDITVKVNPSLKMFGAGLFCCSGIPGITGRMEQTRSQGMPPHVRLCFDFNSSSSERRHDKRNYTIYLHKWFVLCVYRAYIWVRTVRVDLTIII